METAKVFWNGRSQAVRLPASCRFDADEVVVNKIGDAVILTPAGMEGWTSFLTALDLMDNDVFDGLDELAMQDRAGLR